MPRPRKLSDAEEGVALAEFRAAEGRRGTVAMLARQYVVTHHSMEGILRRAERREQIEQIVVSLETTIADESHP